MWGIFGSKKKKQPTVSEKLEETMSKTVNSPSYAPNSFLTQADNENTLSDVEYAETMSQGASWPSQKDKKFLNLVEVLNNPSKQGDFLTNLNNMLSKNLSSMLYERKLQRNYSKGISVESFNGYIQKVSKVDFKAYNR